LYVVIPNNFKGKRGEKSGLPAGRYQFHFQTNQFMDADDNGIDLIEYLNGPMLELKEYFKPEFTKGLTFNNEKLVIDGFNHGPIGKYISLYGFDEIFENLPLTVKEIQIFNRNKEDINVILPENFGKFKNLYMLCLDNCISELPNSICDVKELNILTLSNNSKLKEIPSCIADLPNLMFLNLIGSNNVKLPQNVIEKSVEMEPGSRMFDFSSENN
jgi:hypothetical protein